MQAIQFRMVIKVTEHPGQSKLSSVVEARYKDDINYIHDEFLTQFTYTNL